jgi:hypothetical protein
MIQTMFPSAITSPVKIPIITLFLMFTFGFLVFSASGPGLEEHPVKGLKFSSWYDIKHLIIILPIYDLIIQIC